MRDQDIQKPKAIFWDWDGTIADSYSYLNDAHNHTLTALGLPPFKGDEYRHYFGKPRDILYPEIYRDKADQAMVIFQDYVFSNAHKVETIAGVAGVLQFLHGKHIPMGIVSNKKSTFIQEELKHKDYADVFDHLIGAGDAEDDKPSAAPLALAVSYLHEDVRPDEIWFVGDTENDLLCAQRYGAKMLFFKDNADSDRLEKQYRPFFSFCSYTKLQEFLVAL